jgi:osmotically-inducible protein OsmY
MRPPEGHGGEGSDWHQGSGGYWGQGAGSGQGIGGSGTGFSAAGSWMAGPHSGRGPQGYQRSDARIEEDVCEHLTHHGMLDATGIQVRVENGEVTLAGTVESRQAKRLAEGILDSISGVRDIHNQLRVQRDQDHRNPIMAQAQMGHGEDRGSNGQSQSRGQTQRGETKAGASSS